MKIFIFDLLFNHCERTLEGADATDYFQRYRLFLHLRIVEISKKPLQGTTLSDLKDEGIFIYCLIVEYIRTEYAQKTWLPLQVIKDATENGWLDSLAYFCQIKALHHRPIIYKSTLRAIGAKIKASPATLSFHIKVLLSKGLIEHTGSYLTLKSNNYFHNDLRNINVPVGIGKNKQEQIAYLRFPLSKRNLVYQKKEYLKKSDTLLLSQGVFINDKKRYKKARKVYTHTPDIKTLVSSMTDYFTLSNAKFGALCNRSKSTGVKIQNSFRKLGLITTFRQVRKVTDKPMNRRAFYESCFDQNHFLSRLGYVYKRMANGLILTGSLGQ